MENTLAVFSAAYSQFARLVFSVALHTLISPQEAEEVVQDVFLHFSEALKNNKEIYAPKYWLIKTTIFKCMERQRKHKRHQKFLQFKPNRVHHTYHTTIGTRIEIDDAAKKLLHNLSPEQRNLLVLKYLNEFTHEEIAEILDLPVGTVKSKLARIINLINGNL